MHTWQTIRSSVIGRHSHDHAYAAIVLSGGYEEAGDCGRLRLMPGDIVLHERFEAHVNRFSATGAVLLNLPLPAGRSFPTGLASVPDPDSIVRIAERDQGDAATLLLATVHTRKPEPPADWPDELALDLIRNPSLSLSRWSEKNGLAPWVVSRGFMQVFGVSPSAFRARSRSRKAWHMLQKKVEAFATIAVELGFSDQAHMTRSVKQLTGMPPSAWRPCK